MTMAVCICVLLISRENFRLDRGSVIVILAAAIVPTRPWLLITGSIVLLVVAAGSELIFTRAERRKIFRYIAELPGHVPAFRKVLPGVFRDHG